jgi:hypothetical protein
MRWTEREARIGKRRGAYKVLAGRINGKRPLENLDVEGGNVKMDLKELGFEILDCTCLGQERDSGCLNAVMKLRVP